MSFVHFPRFASCLTLLFILMPAPGCAQTEASCWARVHEQDPAIRTRVILPESEDRFRKTTVTTEDADYLILSP
jgi:hypothetical protein